MNQAIELAMEFYYQSLYYVSGLVIIACSYQWSIMGLFISAATCYGLLRGFNKKILAFIVFMDLSFLLVNYIFLLVTYPVVQKILGEAFVTFISHLALFLGFFTSTVNDVWTIFYLNIIIFYFSVESYTLEGFLTEDRFDEEGAIRREGQNE